MNVQLVHLEFRHHYFSNDWETPGIHLELDIKLYAEIFEQQRIHLKSFHRKSNSHVISSNFLFDRLLQAIVKISLPLSDSEERYKDEQEDN